MSDGSKQPVSHFPCTDSAPDAFSLCESPTVPGVGVGVGGGNGTHLLSSVLDFTVQLGNGAFKRVPHLLQEDK